MHLNIPRCRRLVENAIGTFGLDLSRLTVLTEAATGYFGLTPMIAALANAERVVAIGRDSRYGPFETVKRGLIELAGGWDVAGRLTVVGDRHDPLLSQADVVTNLGFVRPLDAQLLRRLKPSASVALMWETWEFRPADLDLAACRTLGIPVLGTNEEHPDLKTFSYLGHVAIKLLFELDIEVFRSRIVVLGSGKFAASIASVLRVTGAGAVDVLNTASARRDERLVQADAIVIAEHERSDLVLGRDGWLDPYWLIRENPAIGIAHICGHADKSAMEEAGLRYTPSRLAGAGYMSVTTDYVGPRPLVDLHTAGLKVGALLARCRLSGLSAAESEFQVLQSCPMAQAFERAATT